MRNIFSLFFLPALLILNSARGADKAPLTYQKIGGTFGQVQIVTGVSADGTAQVPSYTGTDGKNHSPVVQERVCSVLDGVAYLCPDSSGDGAPGLVVDAATSLVTIRGNYPTADPLVAGQVWQNNGVMMLSTGAEAMPNFSGDYLRVEVNNLTDTLAHWLEANNSVANIARTTANAAIPLTQKGAASGVAALDQNGNVTAPIVTTGTSATGALTVTSSTAALTGSVSGTTSKWTIGRRSQDAYMTLKSYNGSAWQYLALYDSGDVETGKGTLANLGADAPFTGTLSAPTITATTSASVPDTSTTDSSTAALNTESAAARFASKSDESNFATETDLAAYLKTADASSTYLTITDAAAKYISSSTLSAYLKTADAASTYAPLVSPALTGTPTATTPATSDNSTNIATTAFVMSAVQSASGSVTGDISASGSSLSMPVGSSGLTLTMSYVSSGTGSLSIVSTNGTITPVDIYETAAWGTTSFKGYVLDSGTVTTTSTTVDSTFYLNSNAWGTYHIRAGGSLYVVDVFGSGKGARTTMSWRKLG